MFSQQITLRGEFTFAAQRAETIAATSGATCPRFWGKTAVRIRGISIASLTRASDSLT